MKYGSYHSKFRQILGQEQAPTMMDGAGMMDGATGGGTAGACSCQSICLNFRLILC